MWAELSFVLLQSTHLSDGRTDRETAFSWLYRALCYMQSHGKMEKKILNTKDLLYSLPKKVGERWSTNV